MPQDSNFLHTTHRTITWFNKAFQNDELELAAPFQRNPVWTCIQKSYLIDTILLELPVPELYMQDLVDPQGSEMHIVVDGQQRIRACLEFVAGDYALEGEDVSSRWRGSKFVDLSPEEKQAIFSYKFVVRVLPQMREDELRKIFARLNRNVVALNEQELRNATYWGPFITTIQTMADDDPFWSESSIFTANDIRRMLDHEYISELAAAYLHGPQNKKDKLDTYYQLYEEAFEAKDELVAAFRSTTSEISRILPNLASTRWKKKSDFYTLFLVMIDKSDRFPFSADQRDNASRRLLEFGNAVTSLSKLDPSEWENPDPLVTDYTRAVGRAASDRGNRETRKTALTSYLFDHG
jgi:uncharacterized protein with ParB-like and HNH nuclease domain